MVVADNYPANGVDGGAVSSVKLAFTEALALGPCGTGTGNATDHPTGAGISIVETATPTNVKTFLCDAFKVVDNTVTIAVDFLADGTYHVVVDTGALKDKAGND